MRITKRKILIFLVIGMFSVTFVSWAYQGSLFKLQIKTTSRWDSGVAANVISLNNGKAYSVHNSRAHKLAGIPVYKIELAKWSYSELAQIYLSVNNFTSMNGNKKLSKSNWWVEVSAYYVLPSTAMDADLILDDGTHLKRLSDDTLYLNGTKATGLLMPETMIPKDKAANSDTLYIVATYVNPGGSASSGQQDQLNDLKFYCNVRV